MNTRYLFFHTAKAAIFQFYAFLVLLLLLYVVKFTFNFPQSAIAAGTLLYVAVVVTWAFRVDHANRGNRGV